MTLARPVLALMAAAAALASCGGEAGTKDPPARGARVVAVERHSARMVDLTLDSPAVGRRVPVRLLLPRGFARRPERRWPVLYLLHGCCDGYESWTRSTDVERWSARSGMLIVMPDGGRVGFYSNWLRGPAWETFHLTELREVLERRFRAGGRRAVAGLSMGGLGAMGYAARHPGFFRAAASFSGLLHTRGGEADVGGVLGLVEFEGEDARALWGDPQDDAGRWAAHNPYDLAGRLRGTRLFVASGDGRPGPLDASGAGTDGIEQSVNRQTTAFVARLRELAIPARVDLYGPGTHDWPYWERELHRSWPLLARAIGAR